MSAVFRSGLAESSDLQTSLNGLQRDQRALCRCLRTIRLACGEQDLLQGVCDSLCQEGDFHLVWMGRPQGRGGWSVLGRAGEEARVSEWAARWENGHAEHVEATGRVLQYGGEAMLVLPIALEAGDAVLALVSNEVQRFGDDRRDWLVEVAGCVSTRLAALRERAEQLDLVLDNTIDAIRMLGELRDPYTAGHERRVGDLAEAIGRFLGLSAHQQTGLRVAGYLHDIGKIVVPSEILSKPGRLNAAEMALMQAHAQAGYDILKGIPFPWPVAVPVLQHHERLDGSGYPHALSGDAIGLEARILGVADVMEAMASHRPYRPALGFEAAMAELQAGRGVRYDAAVVDACCQVFESGFLDPTKWQHAA